MDGWRFTLFIAAESIENMTKSFCQTCLAFVFVLFDSLFVKKKALNKDR